MTHHFHAIVWIDHSEARVFHFNESEADKELVRSHKHDLHLHHKANSRGSGHAGVDKEFLERVAKALHASGAVLIVGPASAKTELAAHIGEHDRELAKRISGVETVDHPSDGVLLALARKFFRADDRMHWQAAPPR
ncbi:MAG: translational machinery protein [Steroidobacteraceae bacterium]